MFSFRHGRELGRILAEIDKKPASKMIDLGARLDPFVVSSEKHDAFTEALRWRWARMADKSKLQTPIMDAYLGENDVSTFKLRRPTSAALQYAVQESPWGYRYWSSGDTDVSQWPPYSPKPEVNVRPRYRLLEGAYSSPESTIPRCLELQTVAQPAVVPTESMQIQPEHEVHSATSLSDYSIILANLVRTGAPLSAINSAKMQYGVV